MHILLIIINDLPNHFVGYLGPTLLDLHILDPTNHPASRPKYPCAFHQAIEGDHSIVAQFIKCRPIILGFSQ
jgi:hypothetical protein